MAEPSGATCRFTKGSLYCVNDPCGNPNHFNRAKAAKAIARQWNETPKCIRCGVLTVMTDDDGRHICGACQVAS